MDRRSVLGTMASMLALPWVKWNSRKGSGDVPSDHVMYPIVDCRHGGKAPIWSIRMETVPVVAKDGTIRPYVDRVYSLWHGNVPVLRGHGPVSWAMDDPDFDDGGWPTLDEIEQEFTRLTGVCIFSDAVPSRPLTKDQLAALGDGCRQVASKSYVRGYLHGQYWEGVRTGRRYDGTDSRTT